MNRRTFLAASAATQLASTLTTAQAATLPIKKAILYGMLPKQMPMLDRFQMAKEIGFEEMECPQIDDPAEAEAIKKAADQAKLRIHSVMNGDHWRFPLNSNDPEVVAKSMKAMRTSLGNAKLWGADTVLLVPAVVNPEHSYAEAYKRSQARIRELIPMAAEYKVVIAVEEVWNKFLLSPMEFARYVDEFNSPWVKAYFDVGNVVLFAYPQDWIRTLGKRIVKLHFKDFKFQQNRETRKREAEFVNLGEGEIDWKAIHAALTDIGYRGSATVELSGGDRDYLADVSKRVDKILAGA
jgi:L-ribulose-5-phosphate 3-epimerase